MTSTAPRAEKAVVILPGLGNSAGDYTALASQVTFDTFDIVLCRREVGSAVQTGTAHALAS